jgi:hypothetical protein
MKLQNVVDMKDARKKHERKALERRISRERSRVDDMLKATPELGRKK